MRKPGGYAVRVDPVLGTTENDTFTCGHCGAVVFVKPAADPASYGGWCGGCSKLICQRCEAEKVRTLKCRPIEQWLERQEAQGRSLRSFGL